MDSRLQNTQGMSLSKSILLAVAAILFIVVSFGACNGDATQVERMAPPDQPAFNSSMVGNRFDAEHYYIDFLPDGRFVESDFVWGSYSYSNTGANQGTLGLDYDDATYGGSCTINLTFDSATGGDWRYSCASGITDDGDWRVSETP